MKKETKRKIHIATLKALFYINFSLWLTSLCMLDSMMWIPWAVFIVTGLFLTAFLWVNGWFGTNGRWFPEKRGHKIK